MKRAHRKEKPRKLFVHVKDKQKFQPVNPHQWSESSKRSISYMIPPPHYQDIHYKCARCRRDAVFSAVEQKVAFEGRKVYIWQRRSLCSECWSESRRIERRIRECQTRWRTDKRMLRRDSSFLRQWLELLEAHPNYGARKNNAGITMLRRLLIGIDDKLDA